MPTAAPTPHSEEWVKLTGPEDDNSSVDVSVDFSSHGEPTGRVSRKAVQVLGHELAGAKVIKILGEGDGNMERAKANENLINARQRQMLERLKHILRKPPPTDVVRIEHSIREQAKYSYKAKYILGDPLYDDVGRLGYIPLAQRVSAHELPRTAVARNQNPSVAEHPSEKRRTINAKAVKILGEDPRLWGFKASQVLGNAQDADEARRLAREMEKLEIREKLDAVLSKRPSPDQLKLPGGMTSLPSQKASQVIGSPDLDRMILEYVPRTQDNLPPKSKLKVASLTGATENLVPQKVLKVLGPNFAAEAAEATARATVKYQY